MVKWLPAAGAALLVLAAADAARAQVSPIPAPEADGVAEGGQPDAPPPPPPLDRNPRKKLFESDDGTLFILNRVQFRWTQHWPDDTVLLSGTENPGDGKGEFRIRRAKTELTGWLFRPELTYELQLSWAGPEAGASTQTPLEDFYLTWDVSKKQTFMVTLGQFKVPLGRQEMTSSGTSSSPTGTSSPSSSPAGGTSASSSWACSPAASWRTRRAFSTGTRPAGSATTTRSISTTRE